MLFLGEPFCEAVFLIVLFVQLGHESVHRTNQYALFLVRHVYVS